MRITGHPGRSEGPRRSRGVLLVCSDAHGGHGGIALFNRHLAAAIAESGSRVLVLPRIAPEFGGLLSQPAQQSQAADRDSERREPLRIPNHLPASLPSGVTLDLAGTGGKGSYLRAVLRIRKSTPFDLVICGHINLLPFARLVTPHPLLVVHGIEAWRPARARKAAIPQCRAIVSVSALTRDRLVGWSGYEGPTFVLPNAIPLEQFGVRPRAAALAQKYGVDGRRVVLTVARVDPAERTKGFDEIIEVLPRLPSDVVYLIAGGGDDIPRLTAKASALGVSDRVIFTGRFPEEEKPGLYSLADVYAMPSRGEGFGFVFLEALASGLPVIASRHDGGREALLGGKLGKLVDPSCPAEIAVAIENALAIRERRIPEGLEQFGLPRFNAQVRGILDAVSQRPSEHGRDWNP